MVILENIDIDIVIDKAILQNIDTDKISNRFKFGISNRATGHGRWKVASSMTVCYSLTRSLLHSLFFSLSAAIHPYFSALLVVNL